MSIEIGLLLAAAAIIIGMLVPIYIILYNTDDRTYTIEKKIEELEHLCLEKANKQ